MPNHVANVLSFSGDQNEINKLFNTVIGTDDQGNEIFDFNKVIKTPAHIFQGNLGEKERKIYGSNNWYDWNINNWGTKWNAYDCDILRDKNSIIFSTAWSFPKPIARELSAMFKDININWVYADEDMGYNAGKMISKNGEVYIEEYSGGSDEAYKAYIETHGDINCIKIEDDGHITVYDCDTCPHPC